MERRVKIVFIGPETILALFDDPKEWVKSFGNTVFIQKLKINIPEGTIVQSVDYYNQHQAFGFIVHHPDFEEVKLGDRIPIFDGAIETIRVDFERPKSGYRDHPLL